MGEPKVSAQLQQFIAQEEAKAQVQQLVATVTEVCWDKCVPSPGRSLSAREETCLGECGKRFIEATQFIITRAARKGGA